MRFDRVADWLAWQAELHPKAIDLGLERCATVARGMRYASSRCKKILVAGTNGKGSSVMFMERILNGAGYRVGAYLSPHLVSFNERIRVCGLEVRDPELLIAFDRVDRARGDIRLTQFEFITLAAMQIFMESELDVILLEVGLGGRLDAVNVFDADVALVTVVDIDHTDWLGAEREQIAAEKAGILRRHKPVVCVDRKPPRALRTRAKVLAAPWYGIGSEFDLIHSDGSWHWQWGDERILGIRAPRLPGAHQFENAAGAIMAVKCLGDEFEIDDEAVRKGIADASLVGRFQVRAGEPEVVFDVAHNKQAARALAAELRRRGCRGATHVVLAMLIDKDIDGVVEVLAEVTDEWHVCGLGGPRGTSTERMVAAVERNGGGKPLHSYHSIESAYRRMCSALTKEDRGVVCGSFHTVGEALRVETDGLNLVGP